MPNTEEYDIVVVGAGTSGSFAAGTAANEGLEVALLERKSDPDSDKGQEKAGEVACGDAVHDPLNGNEFKGPFDMQRVGEKAEADTVKLREGFDSDDLSLIERGLYWDDEMGVEKEVDFGDNPGNVVDRPAWGQALIEEAEMQGADVIYDTVVNDVIQDGRVEGVKAVRDGDPVRYEADLVIDAGGALSHVQQSVDFDTLTDNFEEPHFDQYGAAYREILELDKPLSEFDGVEDYSDALVIKPVTESLTGGQEVSGRQYIWYFPRSETEINAGLGFQMSDPSFPMVDVLRKDLERRPEFQDATIKEGNDGKLGAALGLRRPLDSAVAPGYIAVGDAAGMVSPTTGKGITGAAISGYSAGKFGAEAVMDGDVSEEALWPHNRYIFSEHGEGARLTKQDVYNVAGSAYDLDELRGALALIPIDPVMDAIGGDDQEYGILEQTRMGAGFKWNSIKHGLNGAFDPLDTDRERAEEVVDELRELTTPADELKQLYLDYPEDPSGFDQWREDRDAIDRYISILTTGDSNNMKY